VRGVGGNAVKLQLLRYVGIGVFWLLIGIVWLLILLAAMTIR
jgi:hypothetical protein